MKNKKYYFLTIIFSLILVFVMLGYNHLYGSSIDWLSQHSIIPEYFRNSFYETGKFIPNFAFNLGAGQNIYNYSYYGLLSPIILISYFFPFIKMITYIEIASIVLFILLGVLMFKFINNNFRDRKLSFFASLTLLLVPVVNFHFHHHIMFVWYLPFLLMAFMGVDKYIEKNNSYLLIIGTFLVIMTNYYYSVGSLVAIYLYGIYKLLEKKKFKLKEFIGEAFLLGIKLIIPVLMAMIILLPTLRCLSGMDRAGKHEVGLLKLLIPNFKEIFYDYDSMGLTGILFLSLIGNIFFKKKKNSDLFLNVSLLLIICIPLFMFILNGGLYIRGKVLIPFIPLVVYCFISFFKNLFNERFNICEFIIFIFIVLLVAKVFNETNVTYVFSILFSVFVVVVCFKKRWKFVLSIYVFLGLLICAFLNNCFEEYVTLEHYDFINNPNIGALYKKIDDDDFYRSYNKIISKDDPNKVYDSRYYSPSIYSSTYNSKYWKFYNFMVGNNIVYRNKFITAGTDNDLFYTYMGVKYMTIDDYQGLYYKKIINSKGVSLYKNDDAYPVLYVSNNMGSNEMFDKMEFPYNLEYLMNNALTDSNSLGNVNTKIKKYENDSINDLYEFNFKKDYSKKYKIDKKFLGKIMYISFDMKRNTSCQNEDLYITINGIKNKLSCKGALYHNKNNKFQYVIPITSDELILEIGKGKYKITNVEVYYSSKLGNKNIQSLQNIKIDKRNSVITCNINLESDNYLVTTIPYDKGFKAFVNGREVKTEIVNKAFLGLKLAKGNNKVKIVYTSPGYELGKIISILGFIIFFIVMVIEYISRKNKDYNQK